MTLRGRSCFGWQAAATTPTWAASRPARCRPTPGPSRRKASISTISKWWIAAISARRSSMRSSPAPNTRRAMRSRTSTISKPRSPPMNAGCLRPINIVIPPRSMLSPEYPAAVVAGNVEVSQAVTDALFGALGALAAAQGTMNNLNFGNARYQYYETICSGSPAGPGFPGTDAVHTHMTNTRLTDPEGLEFRYPVVLEDFHIRAGSGGRGKWNACDGVRLTIRILA